jgi:hypothetical protein
VAVRINADGTLTVLWHAPSGLAGSPVLGGGRLFALDTGAGQLHLLDPASGADRGSVSVGTVTRFSTPALYYNAVLVGTTTGVVAFNWS